MGAVLALAGGARGQTTAAAAGGADAPGGFAPATAQAQSALAGNATATAALAAAQTAWAAGNLSVFFDDAGRLAQTPLTPAQTAAVTQWRDAAAAAVVARDLAGSSPAAVALSHDAVQALQAGDYYRAVQWLFLISEQRQVTAAQKETIKILSAVYFPLAQWVVPFRMLGVLRYYVVDNPKCLALEFAPTNPAVQCQDIRMEGGTSDTGVLVTVSVLSGAGKMSDKIHRNAAGNYFTYIGLGDADPSTLSVVYADDAGSHAVPAAGKMSELFKLGPDGPAGDATTTAAGK